MSAQLTDQLLDQGESERVEFNSAVDGRDQIAQAVCAFLKTRGGVVLVGVDDEGRPNGTANDQQTSALFEFLQEEITPGVLFTVSLDHSTSGPVIAVDVPAGPDTPYVFGGAAYVRDGSTTRAANARQLKSLVTKSAGESDRWERRRAALDDLGQKLGDEQALAQQARLAGVLGAVLRDLKPLKFEAADARYHILMETALGVFDIEQSQSISVEVRIEAAEALGQAGDPRLEAGSAELRVHIPAGKVLDGQSRGRTKTDELRPEGV
ncbi:MAG: ATP-binding protein [Planctomycetota bacterium]|nr:ATP-binding protein [Planctomycetota bacterium]